MIQESRLVNHEAGSHTFSGLRGLAITVPLGFDSMAPQHSTPNVGGDTLRDNSAKNKSTYRILVTQNLSVVSKMELFVSSSQNKTISVVRFLKLQPNPIRARLALTRGCMANGSHAVRMDPLFEIPTFKICETEKYF